MASDWYPLEVGEASFSRISLDFGLRGANQHFVELVVPGIGGTRFVRQLSWAVAGLAMRDTFREHGVKARATPLANAIEALGCKSEYQSDPGYRRVIGRRAFARDGADVASFAELRERRHYVQNTFRATVVRALRDGMGLGFTRGARFDALELEPVGHQLAQALLDYARIGQGNATLRTWLRKWIGGDKVPTWTAVREVLSPRWPSKLERSIVRARLIEVDGPEAEKRKDLAGILMPEASFPGVDMVVSELRRLKCEKHARQVELAVAFGALLDACIDVTRELSAAIDRAGQLTLEAARKRVDIQLGAVVIATTQYLARAELSRSDSHTSAHRFALDATTRSREQLLVELLHREGRVCELVDGNVHMGPLFRNLRAIAADTDADEGEDEAELGAPDAGEARTFRLARFHELLRDTRGG